MPANPILYNNKKIIEIKNVSNTLLLTWVINNICTNHCSYCPANLHSGTNHHYDWEHAEKFIRDCFKRYGSIQCNLTGGEPTVSPFFKELVNLIYDLGGVTNLTSNIVRSKDWWSNIASKLSCISVSYHPEFMESEEKENDFIEKIIFLTERTRITARVMMHPDYWDQCYKFYQKLKESNNGYCIEMVRILPNFGIGAPFCDIEYNQEQEDILNNTLPIIHFNKLPDDFRHQRTESYAKYSDETEDILNFEVSSVLENSKLNDFYGWSCDIGIESLFVFYNGKVQRGNCAEGGWIGDITTVVNWPSSGIICGKHECHCIADMIISKRIIPEEEIGPDPVAVWEAMLEKDAEDAKILAGIQDLTL